MRPAVPELTHLLYTALTPEQRVVSHAMISMIENHLSWVVLWWRAKYPDSVIKGYQVNLQNALNTRLPNPILNFCYKLAAARKVRHYVTIASLLNFLGVFVVCICL